MTWVLVFLIGATVTAYLQRDRPPPSDSRVERAVAAFQAKYPDRSISGRTSTEAADGSCVVTIIYPWRGIPPRRSWWWVHGDDVEELDHAAASELVDVPVWR